VNTKKVTESIKKLVIFNGKSSLKTIRLMVSKYLELDYIKY